MMRLSAGPGVAAAGRSMLALITAAAFTACAESGTAADADLSATPPGPDVLAPFPIDRGDDPGTPGTYKGLPLRLVDNQAPAVTPVDGVIGVVCVGMSNANQECNDFRQRLTGEYAAVVNPAVRFANCAVGGHAVERWIDPAFDATLWDACISQRLPAAGIRVDQVRVIFHKAANQFTTGANGSPLPVYPASGSDYEKFRLNLSAFAARVRTKFPAVQAVYSSSRSYGGYAGSASRGEPLSYEEGHALNSWLGTNARVDGVWYGWGPYLWAPSCTTGITNRGSVCYDRADYVADGVHPSDAGKAKVSRLLHARFSTEPWYRR
ncbi:MAG: hypothetical protein ACR2GK_07485, partial [Gemmatimonadaceae bacterium]